jgi:hypothetical protein
MYLSLKHTRARVRKKTHSHTHSLFYKPSVSLLIYTYILMHPYGPGRRAAAGAGGGVLRHQRHRVHAQPAQPAAVTAAIAVIAAAAVVVVVVGRPGGRPLTCGLSPKN